MRSFKPRTSDLAIQSVAEGKFELFKMSTRLDATAQFPEWLGCVPERQVPQREVASI